MPGKPRNSDGRARSLCPLHLLVGQKLLEPCRHVADTWVALICEKIIQVVLQEIVLEVVQEVVAYLEGFPGLGEAGATSARRGQ